MKELSIEEKAKRYDEVLIVAKQWYNDSDITKKEKYLLKGMFSELVESEDEKIRREIIEFFKNYSENGTWKAIPDVTKWIAWLEKQGEQKPVDKIEPIVVRDFNSVFSREQVEEIDKRIEESQRLYNAKLRDAMRKVEDFPMTD